MPSPAAPALSVELPSAREALVGQTRRFLDVAEGLNDHALLAASRCHGWAVLDVVVHVRVGLEEMLRGITAPADTAPTVDAATYWSTSASTEPTDPDTLVDGILWTRRTASAYHRPSSAVRHLRDAVEAVAGAATRLPDGPLAFQGHVIAAGDFLATWAVELAVHHLDLGRDLEVGEPTPESLRLARATLGALLGAPVPDGLRDVEAVLMGSGRVPAGPAPMRAVLG